MNGNTPIRYQYGSQFIAYFRSGRAGQCKLNQCQEPWDSDGKTRDGNTDPGISQYGCAGCSLAKTNGTSDGLDLMGHHPAVCKDPAGHAVCGQCGRHGTCRRRCQVDGAPSCGVS